MVSFLLYNLGDTYLTCSEYACDIRKNTWSVSYLQTKEELYFTDALNILKRLSIVNSISSLIRVYSQEHLVGQLPADEGRNGNKYPEYFSREVLCSRSRHED